MFLPWPVLASALTQLALAAAAGVQEPKNGTLELEDFVVMVSFLSKADPRLLANLIGAQSRRQSAPRPPAPPALGGARPPPRPPAPGPPAGPRPDAFGRAGTAQTPARSMELRPRREGVNQAAMPMVPARMEQSVLGSRPGSRPDGATQQTAPGAPLDRPNPWRMAAEQSQSAAQQLALPHAPRPLNVAAALQQRGFGASTAELLLQGIAELPGLDEAEHRVTPATPHPLPPPTRCHRPPFATAKPRSS